MSTWEPAEATMLEEARHERYSARAYAKLWEENQNLKEEIRRLKIRLEAALSEMEKARRLVG